MTNEFPDKTDIDANEIREKVNGTEEAKRELNESAGEVDETLSSSGTTEEVNPVEQRRRRALADYMELSTLELQHVARETESRAFLRELWKSADGLGGHVRTAPKLALVIMMIVVARLGRLIAAHGKRNAAAAMTRTPRSAALFQHALTKAKSGEQNRRSAREHFSEAQETGRWAGPFVTLIGGSLIWGGLITVDYLVFGVFDTNYFRWFLDNGGLIAIVFAFVSLAIDLDRYPSFVSADPLAYLLAAITLFEHVVTSWRLVLEGGRVDARRVAGVPDMLVAAVFNLAATITVLGWVVVIAPLQYLLTLICGAPARLALVSPRTSWYDPTHDEAQVDAPRGARRPPSALVVGYADKPVSLTAAVQAALLWTVNLWV